MLLLLLLLEVDTPLLGSPGGWYAEVFACKLIEGIYADALIVFHTTSLVYLASTEGRECIIIEA